VRNAGSNSTLVASLRDSAALCSPARGLRPGLSYAAPSGLVLVPLVLLGPSGLVLVPLVLLPPLLGLVHVPPLGLVLLSPLRGWCSVHHITARSV